MATGILVVDDDPDDVELFAEAMKKVRPDVQTSFAENGFEAIQQLNDAKGKLPDLMFLDINMPGMSGWECLTALKSLAEYQHVPIIIYTTSSLLADIDRAATLGALCFISKMQDFKDLKVMLEIVLHRVDKNEFQLICADVKKIRG